ncbi:MAG: GTPase [Pseudomonadota bacterium]
MTVCTLVAGGDVVWRVAAIGELIGRLNNPSASTAILFEGVHTGTDDLNKSCPAADLHILTIAPECPCCSDGLVMQVSLNRLLHRRPANLIVGLADLVHLSHLQTFLCSAPYARLLSLAPLVLHDK